MTILLVLTTTMICLALFSGRGNAGTRRELADQGELDGSPATMREVFPDLAPERRVCRHYFNRIAGAPVYCENEFDCRSCHIHSRLADSRLRKFLLETGPEVSGEASLDCSRFFHRGHAWMDIQMDGIVRVGPDRLLLQLIQGRVRGVEAMAVEGFMEQDEPAYTLILDDGTRLPVLAPVSGQVLGHHPQLLQVSDTQSIPLWWSLLRPFELNREIRNLLHGMEAQAWAKYEQESLLKMVRPVTEFAADGGTLRFGSDVDIPWKRIITDMLLSG